MPDKESIFIVVSVDKPAGNALRAVGEDFFNAGPDFQIQANVNPWSLFHESLKKNHFPVPGIRLLFMSGYSPDVIAHHGILDEGVALIQKPFSMADLAEKLRGVLDNATDKSSGLLSEILKTIELSMIPST